MQERYTENPVLPGYTPNAITINSYETKKLTYYT